MARRTLIAAWMALALLACSAPDRRPADITISNGWMREIAPGQSAAAVYLTIANAGPGSDILDVVEAAQGEASVHTTSSANGVARMRPLPGPLTVPGRSSVELKPAGTHIMLTGLTAPPTAGQSIVLTLGFEKSGRRTVRIRVITAAGSNPHDGHGT